MSHDCPLKFHFHAGNECPRRARVYRAPRVREAARLVLSSRRGDAVRDVVGGSDIGLIEDVSDLKKHAELRNPVALDLYVIMEVEIDKIIAGSLEQVRRYP